MNRNSWVTRASLSPLAAWVAAVAVIVHIVLMVGPAHSHRAHAAHLDPADHASMALHPGGWASELEHRPHCPVQPALPSRAWAATDLVGCGSASGTDRFEIRSPSTVVTSAGGASMVHGDVQAVLGVFRI
jgi:hypothetical protein